MSAATYRRSLAVCAAVAILSGCGASLPPTGASPDFAQAVPAKLHAAHGKSWMDLGAARWDLLYVTNGDGIVNVFRYWQKKPVGMITDLNAPYGACADADGHVYIVDETARQIVEYAHGGTKPIHVIDDKQYVPYACSADPHNGNLAVANYAKMNSSRYYPGNIAIYRHGRGKPVFYSDPALYHYAACAYDDRGNLFVTDGGESSVYRSVFAYLAKHAVKLVTVSMSGGPTWGGGFDEVIGLAWDGRHYVVTPWQNGGYIWQVVVKGDQGRVIRRIELNGHRVVGPIAIYNNHKQVEGTQVVATWSTRSQSAVAYWKYPAGGDNIGEITQDLAYPYGVAISLKQR